MRFVRVFSLLTAFACLALGVRAADSGKNSPSAPGATGASAASADAAKPAASASAPTAPVAATREEVEELRAEVAELKAALKKLLDAKAQPDAPAEVAGSAAAAPAAAQPAASSDKPADSSDSEPLGFIQAAQKASEAKPTPIAGWNGEHFFIKSADGKFGIQPYGYVQTDYRAYTGDGVPGNSFAVRRARFGFQGNFGDHFQFAILTEAANSGTTPASAAVVRDVYLNVKFNNAFQIQAGQFKEPFAQEEATGVTNIDFADRGLQSLLYPSAATAFRSPGATIHGDLYGGAFQYWASIFNGKGYGTAANTTDIPETVGRIRVYPWRNHKDSFFNALAVGGSIAYSYSCGNCGERTPSLVNPDASFTFFPQFRTNGNVWRAEAEYTFIHGPWATRGEYVQAQFDRTGVGTLQFGGLGINSLPTVRYKGYNVAATYLLTGEKRPENGTPRVNHPMFGPETPGTAGGRGWGAFEVALRYSGLQGKEPGLFFNNVFTPELVPTFNEHTDQFTAGVNWYPNYWVRLQTNINLDRLKQPSTIGAQRQDYYVFEQRLQFRF